MATTADRAGNSHEKLEATFAEAARDAAQFLQAQARTRPVAARSETNETPPVRMRETDDETVHTIVGHAEVIEPGVEHINRTGGVVAGALPLLYGMAEGIVTGVTPQPEQPVERPPARPAAGRRRSRLHDAVGYRP